MAVTPLKITDLRPPKAPNLPIAPVEYSQYYIDQLLNALRLYFAQVDNFAQPFVANPGGSYLKFPNGAFHQDGNTVLTAAIPNSSSTADIQVADTSGFISAGGLIIEAEIIQYTGKTATTFTGITRGAFGTSGSGHAIGVAVAEAQVISPPATSLAINFTATDTSNQVSIDPLNISRIVFGLPGYYNIQFSAQIINWTTSEDNVTMWFRKMGTDVPFSAGVVTIPSKHGSAPGTMITSWNLVIDVTAGQYIELIMTTDSGNSVLATYPPGTSPVHPASPSIILTATFVSALY